MQGLVLVNNLVASFLLQALNFLSGCQEAYWRWACYDAGSKCLYYWRWCIWETQVWEWGAQGPGTLGFQWSIMLPYVLLCKRDMLQMGLLISFFHVLVYLLSSVSISCIWCLLLQLLLSLLSVIQFLVVDQSGAYPTNRYYICCLAEGSSDWKKWPSSHKRSLSGCSSTSRRGENFQNTIHGDAYWDWALFMLSAF